MKINSDKVFAAYANAYDALYADKDYEAECDFLETIFERFSDRSVSRILDLGCGTGGHDIPLVQRGYHVLGIDRSSKMIEIGKEKAAKETLDGDIRFQRGDVQNLDLDETFDAVICLFAVLGYQTSNNALFNGLLTSRKHLHSDGLFIADFWYGPAVLKTRPSDRVKSVHGGKERIVRMARPKIEIESNLVTVSYHVMHLHEDRIVEEVQEDHCMRYIFKPELAFMMNEAGLEIIHFCSFMDLETPASEDTWNVVAVARAK